MTNNAKFQALINDEVFVKKAFCVDTVEEVQAAFAEQGVEITPEEIFAIGDAVSAAAAGDGELSEDALDSVAGGVIEWIVVGKIVVAVGGAALGLWGWYRSAHP